MKTKTLGEVLNSAIALQPCPSGHLPADKRLRSASPRLPYFDFTQYRSATFFIRRPVREN